MTVRLVAAALFGIGGNSLLMSRGGIEKYITMLNLKIIWSLAAISGIFLTILEGGPVSLYFFLSIFVLFFFIWFFYRIKLKNAVY